MAYTNEYTCTFADSWDRTHVVYLDQESGGGLATAVTPSDDPLVWTFGSPREDEFKTLKPTSVDLRLHVSTATIFNDIAGAAEKEWRLRWTVGGTEVWRGWVLADELIQPVDIPGELVIRAVCGLVLAENEDWIPSSTGVRTLMAIMADALGDVGHALDTASIVNWHAYNGGAAVSGNTLERYSLDVAAFSDRYKTRYRTSANDEYVKVAHVVQQIGGRFAATVYQAAGRWHVIQREAITGTSVSERIYDTSGVYTAASVVTGDETMDSANLTLMDGAVIRTSRAYTKTKTTFAHGERGADVLLNTDFGWWNAGITMPQYWTEVDEDPATAPNTGSIVSLVRTNLESFVGWGETKTEQGNASCLITYIQDATAGDPRAKALVGIRQDSYLKVDTGLRIRLSFVASLRLFANNTSDDYNPRWACCAIWLDGDAGTDYYWSGLGWTSSTLPTHTTAAPVTSKLMFGLDSIGIPSIINIGITDPLPDSGTIRVVLYNVVEHTSASPVYHSGVIYDALQVSLFDDSDEEVSARMETVSTAEDTTVAERGEFDGGTFFLGSIPFDRAIRGIQYSGAYADGWKAGPYAAAEATSGKSLGQIHANQLLENKLDSRRVLAATFVNGSSSTDIWPQTPIDFDSNEYSCVYLRRSARYNEYNGEWVATGVASPTTTEEEGGGDGVILEPWDTLPDDLWDPGPWSIPPKGVPPRARGSSADHQASIFNGPNQIVVKDPDDSGKTKVTIDRYGVTLTSSVISPTYTSDGSVLKVGPLVVHGGTWDIAGFRQATRIDLTDGAGSPAAFGHLYLRSGTSGNTGQLFLDADYVNLCQTYGEVTISNYRMPLSDGDAEQVIQTDGAQVASFATPAHMNLWSSSADTTVANTTTETSVASSVAGSKTLKADGLAAGTALRFHAAGYLSTAAAPTSSVCTLRIKIGSTTVLSAAPTLLNDQPTVWWELRGIVTCEATGVSGSVHRQGEWRWDDQASSGTVLTSPITNTTTATINTTTSHSIDVTAQWTAASVDNTITCTNLVVELVRGA